MRHLTYMRMVAALTVLAAVLMPTALCFGAIASAPHQCCMKQASAWQDGSGTNSECCVVSAPAPNQTAVVTPADPGSKAAAPALIAELFAVAAEQTLAAVSTSEHSPPGLPGRTILRI